MFNIDANLIYEAMTFFKMRGYEFISVPYVVDKDIVAYTLPENRKALSHASYGDYVGSAEQSIYQIIKDYGVKSLPDKCLMITPCQRDEPILDESHLEIFLKIELVSFNLGFGHTSIRDDVLDFYKSLNVENMTYVIQDDGVSYDININNIEVSSYGYRWFDNVLVSYGTGLALPRFEYAVNKGNIK